MGIPEDAIKIMESQNMSDEDDGGGRKTGREVVDGNINNVFRDISRLDRTYGRVSLRKVFLAIQTETTDIYAGAHVILSEPTKDPLVSVCMFTTNDETDERKAAQDRIESYVTQGPRFNGWLWGNQLAGQRQLLLYMPTNAQAPGVGDVLFLLENAGQADEKKQYVRITKVESSINEFTSDYNGNLVSFSRQVVNLDIGDPLRETFLGSEIDNDDRKSTNLYTTVVADAAKYYGVMNLAQPISQNDVSINVDSIFANLVPSAQAESPVVDISLAEAGPVKGTGEEYTINVASFPFAHNAQFHFGRGIKPGSLTITTGTGTVYTDDNTGITYSDGTQYGTVDYSTGTVTFQEVSTVTTSLTAQAIIGTEIPMLANTYDIQVDINNQGYNFTAILEPLPLPGTLVIDYMSQGKWYRLRDNGKGEILPDIANTGSGVVNLTTGSVILTCGALPDIDSSIIFSWGNPIETEDIAQTITIDIPQLVHTVAEPPIKPGSVTISWPTGEGTATATDDGAGNLTGDVTGGSVNYADGKIIFTPTAIPAAGAEYTFDYDKYPFVSEELGNSSGGAGILQITLSQGPVEPGSVSFQMSISFAGYSHIYKFTDHGNGTLSAPGFSFDESITHPEYEGTTKISGLTGTIDYTTKIIQLATGNLTGQDKWSEPIYSYNY